LLNYQTPAVVMDDSVRLANKDRNYFLC
jgi:hypothetical protein